MGSGYSTLFAKHLACGALPLGEVQVQETGLRTMTILIDGSTLQAIKVGKRISFSHHSGRDNRAINTLYGMPSSTFTAVYAHPELKDDEESVGQISIPLHRFYTQWWQAVAGIAFGGLVPQTTWELAEVVKFTACGGLWGKGGKI
jgi:hypothetical protein